LRESNEDIIKANKEYMKNTWEEANIVYQQYKKERNIQETYEDKELRKQHETIHDIIKKETEHMEEGKFENIEIEHFILANILTQSIIKQQYTVEKLEKVDQYLEKMKMAA
jgi:hypothetical protein